MIVLNSQVALKFFRDIEVEEVGVRVVVIVAALVPEDKQEKSSSVTAVAVWK